MGEVDPVKPAPEGRSPAVVAFGALTVAVAVAVELGWLTGSSQAVHVHSGLVPMQATTTAVFALYGSSLVLVGLGVSRRISLACALGGLLIALTTVIAYGLGLVPAFERALDTNFLTDPTRHPGRMSLETAVGLVATGLGLAWRAGSGWPVARPLGVSLLGVATAALGLVVCALLGVQLSVDLPVYEGGMAPHTAATLVLVGIGLALSAIRLRSPETLEPLGAPSIGAGLSLLTLALAITSAMAVRTVEDREQEAAGYLEHAAAVLSARIDADLRSLRRMCERWADEPSQEDWEDDAHNYIAAGNFVLLATRGSSPGDDWAVEAPGAELPPLTDWSALPLMPYPRDGRSTLLGVRLPMDGSGRALLALLDLGRTEEYLAGGLSAGYTLSIRRVDDSPELRTGSPSASDALRKDVWLGVGWVRVALDRTEATLVAPRNPLATLALVLALPLLVSVALQLSATALRRGRELRKSEASLREQGERLRLALDRGAIGTWGIDGTTYEVWLDERSARLMGLEPDAPMDAEVLMSRLHPDDRPRLKRGIRAALRGKAAYNEAFRVCRPDGTVRHVIGQAELVGSASSPGARLIGINIDVTENRRIEDLNRDLERSNRELEEFAYVASHDLQEPLRMVASYMQLFERRYRGQLDEEADKYIHFAVDGAERMQTLINDLLHYSRAGRGEIPETPVDTDRVLQAALENLHVKIQKEEAEVSWEPLPAVRGSEHQLMAVFQNLIENAIKYRGDEPPRVHIGTEDRDGQSVLYVRDNGIGFDASQSERIFRLFQRLHERGRFEGTGIGLAVVARIVSRHRGRVWAESSPGEGATFYLELPLAEDVTKPPY